MGKAGPDPLTVSADFVQDLIELADCGGYASMSWDIDDEHTITVSVMRIEADE